MASSDEKWYYSKERLDSSPSRQCGIPEDKELSFRQQAANFIQDMGQKLKVSQLCINTAIVYMHRFYVFHSFTQFHWASIATASIFLAAKVEEQPRKLEHVLKCASICRGQQERHDNTPEKNNAQTQDLVFNENILLQTLGFDVAIDHPHTHVVRCCHLVRASKDLAQTSYFMASNSLHLTTMCLQYKPTVVACFCIHLVCKWSNWEIPLSSENREWFSYVDITVSSELLKQLTEEFLSVFERCPSRLKEKILSIGGYPTEGEEGKLKKLPMLQDGGPSHNRLSQPDGAKPSTSAEDPYKHRPRPHDSNSSSQSRPCDDSSSNSQGRSHESSSGLLLARPHDSNSNTKQHLRPHDDCREKRLADADRIRHASAKQSIPLGSSMGRPTSSSGHHRPMDLNMKYARPTGLSHMLPGKSDINRDILRDATRSIGLKDHREPNRDFSVDYMKNMSKEPAPRHANEHHSQHAREHDKQMQKRENMLKHTNDGSYSDRPSASHPADKRNEFKSRPTELAKQGPLKHDRDNNDEAKMHLKHESEIKKHLSAVYDKTAYLNKPNSSTSQPRKPENAFDMKSVHNKQLYPTKAEVPNGSNIINASAFSMPILLEDKIKQEIKEERGTMPPLPIKKPSLFSPEKSPSPKKERISPPLNKPVLSFIHTPIPISPLSPFATPETTLKRPRTASCSSEPELRPVMPKIDQVEGFENILRDSAIKVPKQELTDLISLLPEEKLVQKEILKEQKTPEIIQPFINSSLQSQQIIVNGKIETNPTLISNLLKEVSVAPSHLPIVTSPKKDMVENNKEKEKEKDHHKEKKKKNKEKHKHKDRDRSKDEKEKKKKHKERDREKHKHKEKGKEKEQLPAQPIKITIPKDKIQPPEPVVGSGLKIKIPKDRIKPDTIVDQNPGPASTSSGGIKIKISKDVINNFSDNRKREREKSDVADAPPNKISRSNCNRTNDSKMNGRHSYGKVSNPHNNYNNKYNKKKPSDYNHKNHATSMKLQHPPLQQHHQPPPQPALMQQHYYMFSNPPMPPTNMPPPHMNPYLYPNQMFLYNQYPMFSQPTMYSQPPPLPPNSIGAPPLPPDAPPPPPPPPPPNNERKFV